MKIVLPHFSEDQWLLLKNLEWMYELDTHLDYDCIVACDLATNPQPALDAAGKLFRSVELVQYPLATWDNAIRTDWPWPQNNAFANVCRHMSKQKSPWFWCETDCTPLKSGWLPVLEAEYVKGGKPFGGHWNEHTRIFNGVAVYPPKVSRYSQKLIQASMIMDMKGRQTPWDAYCSEDVLPHLHIMNNVMQHRWDLPGQGVPTFPDLAAVAQWIRPEVVLFHRVKDGSLIDRMRELKEIHNPIVMHGQDIVHSKEQKQTIDIFIVTFKRDIEFTIYCLQSIQKFVTGFRKVIIAVPVQDVPLFNGIAGGYPFVVVRGFEEVAGKGMMHHEVLVCSADEWCDAEFILHIDSDCIFKEPVNLQNEYLRDGKPVMLKEKFEHVGEVVGPWRDAVTKALGFVPEYETMRRHPAVHPRWLYPKVREAVAAHTGKPFMEYVLSCRNEFPQGFAEFPVLGAWALKYAPEAHHWIDVTTEPRPTDKLYQFWSHGGLDHTPDDGPAKGTTPRKVINEVLA